MLKQAAALLSRFTQTTRLLRLATPLGADTLLAECVHGEETISGGFTFTISALSHDADIALHALLGQPALLQLLTVDSGQLRPFHGYLTMVELNGANGGLARYTLTLQPWTAFLARGRDSRVFQDMTVFDILDAVFAPYQGMGKLAPAWRFDIAERTVYPVRSLVTQYQESDLAFVERLMHEEGLFYFFEHTGDASSNTLGRHEMVIADHNGAFQPNKQATVRFTQPGAVMKEDSMDRWRSELTLQTTAVELSSWDYRTVDSRSVSASAVQTGGEHLVSRDVPGAYAYASREQGQRIADNHIQALEAGREVFTGAGTVRTLAPGTTFTLADHAVQDDDERRFTITRTVHLMHNNLSADLQAELHRQMGVAALAERIIAQQDGSLHAVGDSMGQRPLYRNCIDAIRASLPFRASRSDGHGRLLHPRPTVRGQQSAIVVGPPGAVIHTDRDHRVKVQFHWQRGDNSHSRLAHPKPDGHRGAPADDQAGTWVRVATPLAPVAGTNWGSHALPRVGQEVLVDFLEGNIDRPVIIGALYNGVGQPDAQHNQVGQGAGAAIGDAAAWFPGESGAHAHAAVLSGIKSQAMQSSQAGSGAYSQLVFDDSPEQARVALQRHAAAHQGTAELNLGHLRHQSDNQRLAPAGFGAELKTEHSTALRAGRGLLLSTDAQRGAHGDQLDSRPAHAQIEASQKLQETLADLAQQHNAKLKTEHGDDELPFKKIAAIVHMARSAAVIDSPARGSGNGDAGGQGDANAYSEQQIQLSAPAGIAVTTPADAILHAVGTSAISAKHDINTAVQGNAATAVRTGISMFTYGKVSNPDKPHQETGIALHTASGKVSTQSQSDVTRLTAAESITVASIKRSVTVAGKEHVLMTAAGAFMRMKGNNIDLHGPGTILFLAGAKSLTGAGTLPFTFPDLPREKLYAAHFKVEDKATGEPQTGRLYRKKHADGKVVFGMTDMDGFTQVVPTSEPEDIKITFDTNEKFHREKMDDEDLNDWFNESEDE